MSQAAYAWRKVPGLARLARGLRRLRNRLMGSVGADAFPGSAEYWRERYAAGGDSGAGSYGKFAAFKAKVLNALFEEQGVTSVVEFGSGDGNQLTLLQVPDYLGVDISAEAVALCRERFAGVPGRRFVLTDDYRPAPTDCALSLDVIYHLVEEAAFDTYMRRLFAAASRLVVIYSSNRDADAADGAHVRHRRFTDWVTAHEPRWRLLRQVPNEHPFRGDYRSGSFADFYIYAPHPAAQ